jgi:hypothetical protein
MGEKTSQPGSIHPRIIEIMKRFPEDISGGQIRQELEKAGLRPKDQTHLDRRKRDLKRWFNIENLVNGKSRNVVLPVSRHARQGIIALEFPRQRILVYGQA